MDNTTDTDTDDGENTIDAPSYEEITGENDKPDPNAGMDTDELLAKTRERHQEHQQEQQAFLDAVADEETSADILETTVTLAGDHTATVRAKLDGQLIDRLSAIDSRLPDDPDSDVEVSISEISSVADDTAQLLDDLVDNAEYDKALFYKVYEREGLGVLATFIERILEALEAERERQEGVADGFREK